jgi:DNA recombination protein RmuC
MEIALLLITLLAIAGLVAYVAIAMPKKLAHQDELSRQRTLQEFEQNRLAHEQALENRLLETQTRISQEQTKSFLGLAQSHLKQESELGQQALKARQGEIDKGLDGLRKELQNVREFVTNTDSERVKSISQVSEMVKESRSVTEALRQDTVKLNEALAGSQSRGQWGERIADDVLKIAGFIEGVNYRKQQTTGEGSRPDFTFMLPDNRTLHMDVKMPMAAFKRYLDADSDSTREVAAKDFLRDTKARIKEVTTRDYINPDDGTLDYTLVFIPNEQVYGFIHENDPEIVDFALKNHVVICSPLTLFAVLSVIRQSIENFKLEARTKEIQSAIIKFRRQWDMYKEQMDKVGNSIDKTSTQWSDLRTKRVNQLDKSIDAVDALRSGNDEMAGLPVPGIVEEEILGLAGADAAVPRASRQISEVADDAETARDTVSSDGESPLF